MTGRGNLGEAQYLSVTQFLRPGTMKPFSQQDHEEIIGCLGQIYTCVPVLYIAAKGEADVVEKRGRVCIVRAVCSGNFTVGSGRPSDNPPQRPVVIRQ